VTRDEFFAKYPKPWRFEHTDRGGGGILIDANDQILTRLAADPDWDDDPDTFVDGKPDPQRRPLMNYWGEGDRSGPLSAEEEALADDRDAFIELIVETFK